MIELQGLFDIQYGHSLELNKLEICGSAEGIAFVSRKSGDNGIAAYVHKLTGLEPAPAGELTCALSGNGVLSTFIQERPYYTAFHVARLKPKQKLSRAELLFYCLCISKNRYKYSWGRQANRTIKNILIPAKEKIPAWVGKFDKKTFDGADGRIFDRKTIALFSQKWKTFRYDEVFNICKGYYNKKPPVSKRTNTTVPFVGASAKNNGITSYVEKDVLAIWDKAGKKTSPTFEGKLFRAGCITISNNGSVGEAFFHEHEFTCSHDVNPVYLNDAKQELNKYIAMFLAALIKQEKYRWGYGRKWRPIRMPASLIRLPVNSQGLPDWQFMEEYIKGIRFSSSI